MVRSYRAHRRRSRRRTQRQPIRGGGEKEDKFVQSVRAVEDKLNQLPLNEIKLNVINPTSKFIVATYWWGRGNKNRNLQNPCPETIADMVKLEVISRRGIKYGYAAKRAMVLRRAELRKLQTERDLTKNEVNEMKAQDAQWEEWTAQVMSHPDSKAIAAELTAAYTDPTKPETNKLTAYPRTFEDMIAEWEEKCKAVGVNYVQVNTEFSRENYQTAINGKPLFIKRVLDAVKGKGPNGSDLGVLYIDGDMWMLKYPHVFDLDGVDFMARGWNTDPRSKQKALKKPAYDPYIFETSGGTMYFGNTETARRLLDKWATSSATPEQMGKADDRILSQVFTTDTMILGTNLINLPIEYLWLTDNYKEYLTDPAGPASIEDVSIEHPYCLTGEERAAGQGAAASREPVGYEEQITDQINFERDPEPFYEYIFFDGDAKKREGFARYLKYMKTAKNHWTGKPLMTLIDFKDLYGPFTPIAQRHLAALASPAGPGRGAVVRGATVLKGGAASTPLALSTSVTDILKALEAGNDVHLGELVDHGPEDECVAVDASTSADGINEYTRKLRIDTTKPMFFSAKSRTLRHLLFMCEKLEDINTHINGSYMFMSRIRWNLMKPGAITVPGGADFRNVVHQIWFGGEMPAWRKAIFDANKAVCEKYGFKYSLWTNKDRTEENFPQTFDLQNDAVEVGTASGQSRWAQVADLARLEIVFNGSGMYVDSIIEISPALLLAVRKGIAEGLTKGPHVFVGCNEDACEPKLDCMNSAGEKYLSNSFFAATRANPIFKRLLDRLVALAGPERQAFLAKPEINHTTGPYFLRSGITPEDNVVMFESEQIYQFNQRETPYKGPHPDRFLYKTGTAPVEAIEINATTEYVPGGIYVLQKEFLRKKGVSVKSETEQMDAIVRLKGPLAIYHSGLGGTWST